ncbi:MAG: hypothetical protein ACJ77A_05895 [Actinomycetota bacterium]
MTEAPRSLSESGERELSRLDPWSFHVLPGEGVGCDRVVIGTTGSFAVVFEGDGLPTGLRVPGLRRARRAARRLEGHVRAIGVQGGVFSILCPRGDAVFAPRTMRGVRVLPSVLLAGEISGRSRSAMPHQVKRAAESLTRMFRQAR